MNSAKQNNPLAGGNRAVGGGDCAAIGTVADAGDRAVGASVGVDAANSSNRSEISEASGEVGDNAAAAVSNTAVCGDRAGVGDSAVCGDNDVRALKGGQGSESNCPAGGVGAVDGVGEVVGAANSSNRSEISGASGEVADRSPSATTSRAPIRAALKGIGAYLPPRVVPNAEFERTLDTSDEWIRRRTGIRERRFADGPVSELAERAARQAIARAGITPADIDAIIVATLSPEHFCMPSTAVLLAERLGVRGISAYDVTAACAGFIYALEQAKSFVESGAKRCVLIVGAEKISSVLDFADRSTCVLFGDGAGAAIIAPANAHDAGISAVHTACDGSYAHLLYTDRSAGAPAIKMQGNEVFKIAVKTLERDVLDTLAAAGRSASDVDFFVAHQANARIIEHVRERLGMPPAKCAFYVDRFGNTSAASIPMAINALYEEGRLRPGHLMLLDAFGGGFAWGSALCGFDQAE